MALRRRIEAIEARIAPRDQVNFSHVELPRLLQLMCKLVLTPEEEVELAKLNAEDPLEDPGMTMDELMRFIDEGIR